MVIFGHELPTLPPLQFSLMWITSKAGLAQRRSCCTDLGKNGGELLGERCNCGCVATGVANGKVGNCIRLLPSPCPIGPVQVVALSTRSHPALRALVPYIPTFLPIGSRNGKRKGLGCSSLNDLPLGAAVWFRIREAKPTAVATDK